MGKKLGIALNLASQPISIITIPFPKCALASSSLTAVNVKLPVVGYEYTLDRYLTLKIDSGRPFEPIRARFEIDPPGLRWNGFENIFSQHVKLFIDNGSGELKRVLRLPISTCASAALPNTVLTGN